MRSDPHGIKPTSLKNVTEERNCNRISRHRLALHTWKKAASVAVAFKSYSPGSNCLCRNAPDIGPRFLQYATRRSTRCGRSRFSASVALFWLEVPRYCDKRGAIGPANREMAGIFAVPRARNKVPTTATSASPDRFGLTERSGNPRRRSQTQTHRARYRALSVTGCQCRPNPPAPCPHSTGLLWNCPTPAPNAGPIKLSGSVKERR
jgi:hypothetical protein